MTAPRAGARQSMIDAEVARHTARADFDPSLITVTHTPNGIVTHVIAADGAVAPVVHFDDASGRVITKTVTEDFGTVLTVLGGPAVVEVALHISAGQRAAYGAAIQAVDQEAMSHVMVASRTAVLTILQHLGMPLDDAAPEDEP